MFITPKLRGGHGSDLITGFEMDEAVLNFGLNTKLGSAFDRSVRGDFYHHHPPAQYVATLSSFCVILSAKPT